MNKPLEISLKEWKEIAAMPEVSESWGLSADETPEDLASLIYGVKFAYISGGPGYVGDLYILHGDAVGNPPFVLTRNNGVLQCEDLS